MFCNCGHRFENVVEYPVRCPRCDEPFFKEQDFWTEEEINALYENRYDDLDVLQIIRLGRWIMEDSIFHYVWLQDMEQIKEGEIHKTICGVDVKVSRVIEYIPTYNMCPKCVDILHLKPKTVLVRSENVSGT